MRQQEVTKLESGQVITHHAAEDCSAADDPNSYCALHRPQPGPWAQWPRHWDSDRQILVRECLCGLKHPAQEAYNWLIDRGQAWKLVHDCCIHVCQRGDPITLEGAKINAEAHQIRMWAMASDVLDVLADSVTDEVLRYFPAPNDRLPLVQEALDLVVELWPSQGRVKMAKETWDRLRRVLLAIPELVTEVEATHE